MGEHTQITLKSDSAEKTTLLGQRCAQFCRAGDVVLLEGALGGGKTTFVRGFARGCGSEDPVRSPTFTLLRRYQARPVLYHMDLYRIAPDEVFSAGLDEYWYAPDTVCVIEWGEKVERYLPRFLKITFSFLERDVRLMKLSLKGFPGRDIVVSDAP
ncbi:MAG: tRNA (adenosine(37)-N6)-threonylcarbamoyltransferase complex ATPase subunit type 1 TsaE [Candidatus Omnitrophica bacterium]|nr:tRNA (adenosine(37)-N6)-threonylcarbamoyltransferase complex ATPase subunit type 1 TsaE [Candidatus Omnitrophota bacterium]